MQRTHSQSHTIQGEKISVTSLTPTGILSSCVPSSRVQNCNPRASNTSISPILMRQEKTHIPTKDQAEPYEVQKEEPRQIGGANTLSHRCSCAQQSLHFLPTLMFLLSLEHRLSGMRQYGAMEEQTRPTQEREAARDAFALLFCASMEEIPDKL